VLAEQERLENAKRELNETKAIADKNTIKARNRELEKIEKDCAQIEQNISQYRTGQGAPENLLVAMQDSAMSAAKPRDETFLQSMSN
jgi:cell division protein FtsB